MAVGRIPKFSGELQDFAALNNGQFTHYDTALKKVVPQNILRMVSNEVYIKPSAIDKRGIVLEANAGQTAPLVRFITPDVTHYTEISLKGELEKRNVSDNASGHFYTGYSATPNQAPWSVAVQQFFVDQPTYPDFVFTMGHNYPKFKADQPQLAQQFESGFVSNPANPAARLSEWITGWTSPDNLLNVRPIQWSAAWDKSIVDIAFQAMRIRTFSITGNQVMDQFIGNDYIYNTIPLNSEFRFGFQGVLPNANNRAWLWQVNAANNAYISLPFIGDKNQVRVPRAIEFDAPAYAFYDPSGNNSYGWSIGGGVLNIFSGNGGNGINFGTLNAGGAFVQHTRARWDGAWHFKNVASEPTENPSDGVFLYAFGNVLKGRKPDGSVVTYG